jgi:cell division protein FtsB
LAQVNLREVKQMWPVWSLFQEKKVKWLERVFIAALMWIIFCACVVVGASAAKAVLELIQ